jgi:hypothetical protein
MYSFKNKLKISNKKFYSHLVLNSTFFKFFLLVFSVKKFFILFSSFFLLYLISNVYFFIYKSLIISKSFLQRINMKHFEDLCVYSKNLIPSIYVVMSKYLRLNLINDIKVINHHYVALLNPFKYNFSLFDNFTVILLNNYIDEFFYASFYDLENFKYIEVLTFIKSMIYRFYFDFINIKYSIDIKINALGLFKQQIDVLL